MLVFANLVKRPARVFSSMAIVFVAALGASATQASTSAYYVSVSGSDRNDGSTPAKAFATLEKARDSMRASSIKTTYLLGGTYKRTAALVLNDQDNGESWLGYPGQDPYLDGGNTATTGISIVTTDMSRRSSNITVRWIVITNYVGNGIELWKTTNDVIDSNRVFNVKGIGIVLMGAVSQTVISHNVVYNINTRGIQLANDPFGNPVDHIQILNNYVHHVNKNGVLDTGAIYVNDRTHSETAIEIANNWVEAYGASNSTVGARAIYLDDLASNVKVHNNVVTGAGGWAFQIHGGDNNEIYQNVVDLTTATRGLGVYEDDVASGFKNYGMANNSYHDNTQIVLCAGTSYKTSAWNLQDSTNGKITILQDKSSRYYNMSPAASKALVPQIQPVFSTACNASYLIPSVNNMLPLPH